MAGDFPSRLNKTEVLLLPTNTWPLATAITVGDASCPMGGPSEKPETARPSWIIVRTWRAPCCKAIRADSLSNQANCAPSRAMERLCSSGYEIASVTRDAQPFKAIAAILADWSTCNTAFGVRITTPPIDAAHAEIERQSNGRFATVAMI